MNQKNIRYVRGEACYPTPHESHKGRGDHKQDESGLQPQPQRGSGRKR